MSKIKIDDDKIKRLYVEEKKMIKEIAELIGCNVCTITRHLQKNGSKRRKKLQKT